MVPCMPLNCSKMVPDIIFILTLCYPIGDIFEVIIARIKFLFNYHTLYVYLDCFCQNHRCEFGPDELRVAQQSSSKIC